MLAGVVYSKSKAAETVCNVYTVHAGLDTTMNKNEMCMRAIKDVMRCVPSS